MVARPYTSKADDDNNYSNVSERIVSIPLKAPSQTPTPLPTQPRQVFQAAGQRYITVTSSHSLSSLLCSSQPSLATTFHLGTIETVTADWVRQLLDEYRAGDDVFNDEFLQIVVFYTFSKAQVNITAGTKAFLESMHTERIHVIEVSQHDQILCGPCLVSPIGLLEVRRLFVDSRGAFLTTFVPHADQLHAEFQNAASHFGDLQVAVPSRLASAPSKDKPFNGLRVAVKDIFQVQDVKTSVCNRAYLDLYPPASKTAKCITLLEGGGASVLGTTKLASFAATEEPVECIDFQAPWNPRGDGYQSPAGSSSGSGVAVAAYDWLDIAIGSDTSGSGRRPGHWNGCFAMRPTHGVLPTEGYIPSFPRFDVPTFAGRDLRKCLSFAKEWYGKRNNLSENPSQLPCRIIYAQDYMRMISNLDQIALIEEFTRDLERHFSTQRTIVSFEQLWRDNPPTEAQGFGLTEFMQDACRNSFFYEDYHSFDKFREDYKAQFHRAPYTSPPVRWQWTLSSRITELENQEAITRLEVYRKWFTEKVMQPGQFNTVVILPIENISPRYRDEVPRNHFNPAGVPMLFISPILKSPELVVPIGHAPYYSRVSQCNEKLPVAVSLLGHPGDDLRLIELALDCLVLSGRTSAVSTGRTMF